MGVVGVGPCSTCGLQGSDLNPHTMECPPCQEFHGRDSNLKSATCRECGSPLVEKNHSMISAYPEVQNFIRDAEGILCNVAQLIDGWNHDGCWGEWDQSVRESVGVLQLRLEELKTRKLL